MRVPSGPTMGVTAGPLPHAQHAATNESTAQPVQVLRAIRTIYHLLPVLATGIRSSSKGLDTGAPCARKYSLNKSRETSLALRR